MASKQGVFNSRSGGPGKGSKSVKAKQGPMTYKINGGGKSAPSGSSSSRRKAMREKTPAQVRTQMARNRQRAKRS